MPRRKNIALENLRARLAEHAEENYKKFSSALVSGCGNMLGVRIPILRQIARESAANGRREFLSADFAPESFEERMIEGLSIGYMKLPEVQMYELVAKFVPKINNWSVCDSFCATLKFMRKNRALGWNFLEPYFVSESEFEARFARVAFLDFFITGDYIDDGLLRTSALHSDSYYALMGAAWAISVCAVKFPEKTLDFLPNLSPKLAMLSVRKICESRRVSKAYKESCAKKVGSR